MFKQQTNSTQPLIQKSSFIFWWHKTKSFQDNPVITFVSPCQRVGLVRESKCISIDNRALSLEALFQYSFSHNFHKSLFSASAFWRKKSMLDWADKAKWKKIHDKKLKPTMLVHHFECFAKHLCVYFPLKLLDLDIFNSLCCRARLLQCNKHNKAAILQIKLGPYILNICASQRILTNEMQNFSRIAVFFVWVLFSILFSLWTFQLCQVLPHIWSIWSTLKLFWGLPHILSIWQLTNQRSCDYSPFPIDFRASDGSKYFGFHFWVKLVAWNG